MFRFNALHNTGRQIAYYTFLSFTCKPTQTQGEPGERMYPGWKVRNSRREYDSCNQTSKET